MTADKLIGETLKRAREARGLSQDGVAEIVGIDRTSVVRCEAGTRSVKVRELVPWVRACGLTPATFVRELEQGLLALAERERGAS